jgi:hypothetical protein
VAFSIDLVLANSATLRECRPRGQLPGITTIAIVGRGAGRTGPEDHRVAKVIARSLAGRWRKAIMRHIRTLELGR